MIFSVLKTTLGLFMFIKSFDELDTTNAVKNSLGILTGCILVLI